VRVNSLFGLAHLPAVLGRKGFWCAYMLSQQALTEFQEICRNEFGQELTHAAAVEASTALLNVLNVTYQPIQIEWSLGE
jgi:hypothetical protein